MCGIFQQRMIIACYYFNSLLRVSWYWVDTELVLSWYWVGTENVPRMYRVCTELPFKSPALTSCVLCAPRMSARTSVTACVDVTSMPNHHMTLMLMPLHHRLPLPRLLGADRRSPCPEPSARRGSSVRRTSKATWREWGTALCTNWTKCVLLYKRTEILFRNWDKYL